MNYTSVIVAAGSGSRTGLEYNKVFHKIADETIIEMSSKQFINDPDCLQVIIVVNPLEAELFEKLNLDSKVEFVNGGTTRQESVYNGLTQVKNDYVMIHDGARPYLSKEIVDRVKNALTDYNACIVMVPTIDTIKIVKKGIIKTTPDRSTLYNAQTPQAFKTDLITNSYKSLIAKNIVATDDAMVVELMSDEEIYVVEGDYSNIKITTVEDLV